MEIKCFVEKREGVSKKTGKPYSMYVLKTPCGDIVLDTYKNRVGVLLSVLYDQKIAKA